jgi:Lrp/AsnC family transcriptional regulator, leucine-responsive regulatory protein
METALLGERSLVCRKDHRVRSRRVIRIGPIGCTRTGYRGITGSGSSCWEEIGVDQVDRQLIDALRADGRASYAELARLVGLSSSAVHERVGKLESGGIIRGYRAEVAPEAIGIGVTAMIGIEPGENGRDEVIGAALDDIPEVESCYSVAGDEAFLLWVRVGSVDELHRLLTRLRAIDGVARTRTTVVLATRFESRSRSIGRSPGTN